MSLSSVLGLKIKSVATALSATLPGPMKSQRAGLAAIPALAVFVVWIAALLAGVASAPDCNLASSLVYVLRVTAGSPTRTDCTSVPFSADFPSLVLAVTCPLAVMVYIVFSRRLRALPSDLVRTGLVDGKDLTKGPARSLVERLEKGSWMAGRLRAVYLLLTLFAGIYLYYVTYNNGQIFKDLARGASIVHNGDPVNLSTLRESWWANYHTHPMLAIAWIAIGTTGTFFAIQQVYLYYRALQFLVKFPRAVRLRALTSWQDRYLGWRPFGGLLALTYVAFLDFVASLVAVLYLLQQAGGRTGNILLGLFALIGLSANLAFLLVFVRRVRRSHVAAVDHALRCIARQLHMLLAVPNHRGKRSDAALLVEAGQLHEARRYPLQGRGRLVVTLLPGLVASTKLIGDAVMLFKR